MTWILLYSRPIAA